MDWGSLGRKIADMGAQVLGEAIPLPGAGMAADALSEALGCEKDPDQIAQAIDQDPEALAKLKKIEAERETELKRIAAKTERHDTEQITQRQATVNDTIQAGYKQGVLWRRAVGWSFAIGAPLFVVGAFVLIGVALYLGRLQAVATALSELFRALHPLLYCYLCILGVAGYQEGKMGRSMAGESESGIVKALKAFRGK
jgi:hypothetical protein